ncbi:MAG: amidohydrolase [Rhodobacteraceae bacterium]|nr:amidohydrolase [Paracoccaceae bacterium]
MLRFDCHAHVYEEVVAVGHVRYLPKRPAPLAEWLRLQQDHGVLGGVIVQVSFLGTDNSQMLRALDGLPRDRFAGIAVIATDTSADEIARLAAGGARGIRWNLVAGAEIPDLESAEVQRLMGRLADHGMHLEMQLESARLAPVLEGFSRLPVPVVIDHQGLPETSAADEPWLDALEALEDRSVFHVKLSAPYRGTGTTLAHAERLMTLLPADRFVWGSDWPHTRHEARAVYDGLRGALADRVDDAAAALRLYGLSAG